MGIIALSQNVSIDGVMQSPGPTDVPYKHRGWAVEFEGDRPGSRFDFEHEVGLQEAESAGALLLGRVTYEAMAASWPMLDGPLADRLNALPKYVVSSTLAGPSWHTTVLSDGWGDGIARLRDELDGDLVVYGSRRLSVSLFALGLVDEVRLTVYPLVLGTGDRLFSRVDDKLPMRLLDVRQLGGGVTRMVYAPSKSHE